MGGRGGTSGRGGGSRKNGGKSPEFSYKIGNKTMKVEKTSAGVTLVDGRPSKISYDAHLKVAKKNGTYSRRTTGTFAAERAKHRSDKAHTDYEQGVGIPWGNRDNRRAARASRLQSRASKRK